MNCSCLLSDGYFYFNNLTITIIHMELLQLSKRQPDYVSIGTYFLFLDSYFFSCFTLIFVYLDKFLPPSLSLTEYTECQAFFPVVQIGSPRPLTPGSVAPRPFRSKRRHTRLRGRGWGDPVQTTGYSSDTHHLFCLSSQSILASAL